MGPCAKPLEKHWSSQPTPSYNKSKNKNSGRPEGGQGCKCPKHSCFPDQLCPGSYAKAALGNSYAGLKQAPLPPAVTFEWFCYSKARWGAAKLGGEQHLWPVPLGADPRIPMNKEDILLRDSLQHNLKTKAHKAIPSADLEFLGSLKTI